MIKIILVIFLLCLQINSFSFSLLPGFTAVYNSRKKVVVVKWQHTSAGVKTYVPQHSVDNKIWTDIASQEISPVTKPRSFSFEDKKIAVGENYYRLKCINRDGKIDYSMNVMVIIGAAANSWVIYPVPVTDLLTLEYRGAETIKGVINVFIQQSSGKMLFKLRYSSQSTLIRIPVGNLSKGIYDIRIVVQNETIWNQRFIK